MKGATASEDGKKGLVPAPTKGAQGRYLRGDGTWQNPPDTNTTYGLVTNSSDGLMSVADKKLLTELSGKFIIGGSRGITANTTGAWYRLGYAERTSDIYGEFIVCHNWSNNPPDIVKFAVGCAASDQPTCAIENILCSAPGAKSNTLIPKARLVYYPAGTASYNIYVDIFIKSNGAFWQGSNIWQYMLSKSLYPKAYTWIDSAFGDATVPSGYTTKEFSFV